MPVLNEIGVSHETALKHRQVGKVLPLILGVNRYALSRSGGTLRLIDLNAASGQYDFEGEELKGSALIMSDFVDNLDLPVQVVLIEKSAALYNELVDNLVNGDARHRHFGGYMPEAYCGDNRVLAPKICAEGTSRDRGVVLFDPNGPDNDESGDMFALAADLSCLRSMQGVDFLLHVPTRTLKMIYRAAHSQRFKDTGIWKQRREEGRARLLSDRLASIHKAHWMVRKPYGSLGWTFLYGTNYRLRNGWANEGFYWTDTPEGQSLLSRLSQPQRELHLEHYDEGLFSL